MKSKIQENEELKEEFNNYKASHKYNNTEFKQERDSLINEIKYKNRYRRALNEIEETIKNLEKQDILTFPDFSLQENCKVIMKQCNDGYLQILSIINKAKDNN